MAKRNCYGKWCDGRCGGSASASDRDGHVVLALVSGEMVVKRYKSNGQQMLVPDAAGFETIPVTEDVKILGVIYRVMRKTR